jgi:hypothetical protein
MAWIHAAVAARGLDAGFPATTCDSFGDWAKFDSCREARDLVSLTVYF